MNILLAEDHTVIRNGLRMLLETDKNIKVAAEAMNGQEVLDLLEHNNEIDVVLSDINMPVIDGIALTTALKLRGSRVKVVILSMHEKDKFIYEAFHAGAFGYLLKSVSTKELIYALNHIYSGGHYLCADLAMAMVNKNLESSHPPKSELSGSLEFSPREIEILKLIAEGLTNQEVSDKLFLSKRTIEGHRQSLIEKTGVRNTAGLISFAMRNGLIH